MTRFTITSGSVVMIKGSKLAWVVWLKGPDFFRASTVTRDRGFRTYERTAGYNEITAVLR